jgi:hypothetical protein
MQRVTSIRTIALGLTLLLTVAAGFATSATFQAASPGADLEPVGDAAGVIDLIQGQQHLLWSSLTGTVTSHTTVGWPSSDGDVELGGGLTIERTADGSAGVIEVADKPMTVSFELDS